MPECLGCICGHSDEWHVLRNGIECVECHKFYFFEEIPKLFDSPPKPKEKQSHAQKEANKVSC